jgi:GR25 family glycosyltransferase involved in LPS biosynthesis
MKKLLLVLFLIPLINLAQSRRQTYIDTYKDIAIREMKIYNIPASITLAQGILESGDGQSRLATKANNHFGIKCHNGWTGGRIYHDDDKKGECFRKYKHAEESFRDHSEFLSTRSRYASLFELDRTDYRAWAKGLQKAGYATSKTYASTLIKLIQQNELHQYDLQALDGDLLAEERIVTLPNKSKYVVLEEGENLEDLSNTFNRSVKKLLHYNDLTYEANVTPGDRIYIRAKKSQGSNKYYKVKSGDTMHSISQREGITLERLYWRNRKPVGWQPQQGETIRLRGRVKK